MVCILGALAAIIIQETILLQGALMVLLQIALSEEEVAVRLGLEGV